MVSSPERKPTEIIEVDTPIGVGRLYCDLAPGPVATVVLGHGAGGGVGALDLDRLAGHLPGAGINVVRFEQPWRTAGCRVAAPPPRLDLGWRAALNHLLVTGRAAGLLFVGGRSAGARVACRTAPDYPSAGVICLAFPLHPPGRPDRSRAAELLVPTVPRLVLQGSRDAFGTPAEVRAAVGQADVTVVELSDADHGFRVPPAGRLTAAALGDLLTETVRSFVAG